MTTDTSLVEDARYDLAYGKGLLAGARAANNGGEERALGVMASAERMIQDAKEALAQPTDTSLVERLEEKASVAAYYMDGPNFAEDTKALLREAAAALRERDNEPKQVSIEQLTATNADLAAQVELQTNVCAYFKKVHADALEALRERDKELDHFKAQYFSNTLDLTQLRARVADAERAASEMNGEFERASQRVAELEAGLTKHGCHLWDCNTRTSNNDVCTCGLTAILSKEPK